ncbi:nuclear transport factor 2 family protein [Solihabitans fulvus]|uniref:Nuclear transport factor 2 family protein n=1 Tax=Solihabitans fulvus TaxID=1892852 RepID=A0A5B2X2W0_9PSEU|nr:nuclear transport factor 2 family protein [Solihabitans fulvus]KAA2257533.1 nuclear transport factor 2 family protein [Solihabitans fulvus]
MSSTENLVARYLEAWNTTDPAERAAVLAEVFTEDARYTDPLVDAEGRDVIDQVIAGAQAQFTGLAFTSGGPVDAHHNTARFSWHLGVPGDEPLVIGFDVAVIENDRIARVYGFLDKVPAA